jgi:hypothetical protein
MMPGRELMIRRLLMVDLMSIDGCCNLNLNAVVLPVVLGDYKAVVENNSSVVIKWNTVSETNNKNFYC